MTSRPYHVNREVVSVRINWKAYFKVFCVEHGSDPVLRGNRLLFSDGWEYSAYDFSGPEHRPPDDLLERKKSLLYYWTERLSIVSQEHRRLCRQRDGLKIFQTNKSVPLQRTVVYRSEEGKRQVVTEDMDLSMFDGRIMWLEADRKECKKQIDQLTEKELSNVI